VQPFRLAERLSERNQTGGKKDEGRIIQEKRRKICVGKEGRDGVSPARGRGCGNIRPVMPAPWRVRAADGEVALIMDGLSIASADFSPIYGQQCKSLTIILEEGSDNTVSDGASYEYDKNGDDEPDAAVFSHDNLIFEGDGRLRVIGNYQEGIRGKDDVTIRSGILEIEAVNDGIKGKDSVEIEGGTITVTAGGDGVQASNDSDADKGYVRITGGGLSIDAAEKGIKAPASDSEFCTNVWPHTPIEGSLRIEAVSDSKLCDVKIVSRGADGELSFIDTKVRYGQKITLVYRGETLKEYVVSG